MKKLLSFLAIFLFLCTNMGNLISCGNIANNKEHLQPPNSDNKLKIDSKTNIDLEKRYLDHPVLIQRRGYKGTLFNRHKTDTIKNLTNAF
ncbi:hypothetical protein [Spiroplasma citri]|uniref:Lipoprotein n=1 Tax=Spiroplasma citri TaxID=2133 RepID=A0AAJ4EL03_SPICI|nr:hypothetical protein [Spiroplasma citri]APE75723.1 hypothetical protein SCITRI_001857 [Spiroplasma citri]QED25497.1 hypothetical protein FRX96_09610 [Spiroplasma citri]QIA67887.1 hypothetical protein GMI18_10150 [Spiroplasma citri]QIA69743.1 hypothetical protein GL298_10110 [Spiroplasma citri]QIA71614.1 hypothetical protein GL981_10180 [Spiroplasma citri]